MVMLNNCFLSRQNLIWTGASEMPIVILPLRFDIFYFPTIISGRVSHTKANILKSGCRCRTWRVVSATQPASSVPPPAPHLSTSLNSLHMDSLFGESLVSQALWAIMRIIIFKRFELVKWPFFQAPSYCLLWR